MQSCQIPWEKMKCIYVTLICIRKFQDRFPWTLSCTRLKSFFQSVLHFYLFTWQRSVEIILLFCQVKCWYWKYWNSQQDIWLLWSILLQLLNRHSWAGCGLKIRMLIPRFFPGKPILAPVVSWGHWEVVSESMWGLCKVRPSVRCSSLLECSCCAVLCVLADGYKNLGLNVTFCWKIVEVWFISLKQMIVVGKPVN